MKHFVFNLVLFVCLFSIEVRGQTSADFSGPNGGSVILGFDNRTCDGSIGGAIRYDSSANCAEFCSGSDWICPSQTGSGCQSIGDTCNDGSIFAGLSPDGLTKMYTTPADAASTYTWNDGTTNYRDIPGFDNCTDVTPGTAATCQTGEANTAFLVAAAGETDYPFAAAEYCDGLTAHGHSDWYLPAQDELDVLYDNKNAGDLSGTFNETGSFPAGWYWSSSERVFINARVQRFSDGTHFNYGKNFVFAVRCVRR